MEKRAIAVRGDMPKGFCTMAISEKLDCAADAVSDSKIASWLSSGTLLAVETVDEAAAPTVILLPRDCVMDVPSDAVALM